MFPVLPGSALTSKQVSPGYQSGYFPISLGERLLQPAGQRRALRLQVVVARLASIQAGHPAAPGWMQRCFSGVMLTGPPASREEEPVHQSTNLLIFRL